MEERFKYFVLQAGDTVTEHVASRSGQFPRSNVPIQICDCAVGVKEDGAYVVIKNRFDSIPKKASREDDIPGHRLHRFHPRVRSLGR